MGVLAWITLLPLFGAGLCMLVPREEESIHRGIGLLTAIVTLVVSLLILPDFDSAQAGFQLQVDKEWIAPLGIRFHLGIDGISLWLVLLTTFLMPVTLLSPQAIGTRNIRVREFVVAMLVLEAGMIGAFLALDLFVFYVFWELMLIPMYFIIGIWGGERRLYASIKFVLYTLVGSLLMLVAILATAYAYAAGHGGSWVGAFDFEVLRAYAGSGGFADGLQLLAFVAFFLAFAIKVPMFPFHTLLPDAHVQAPTAGSVILAGILLKLGGYGFIRFSLPMFPEGSYTFIPLVFVLSGVAVVYTSLVALVQRDMKKLIAYSSVAHMAFVTFGLFAMNRQGIEGAMIVMLSHGLVSGALFLVVGVIYDRLHTREIAVYGGVANNMPGYALLFMLFSMASVGLPGTSGFVGEFLSLLGTYKASSWAAIAGTTGIILSAAYMLYLYWRICFGAARTAEAAAMPDLSVREWWLLAPIALAVLWMGVYPESFIRPMRNDVGRLITRLHSVAPVGDSHLTLGKAAVQAERGATH